MEMRAWAWTAYASAILAAGSGAVAAEPVPATGPAPAWVIAPAVPAVDPADGDAPFQFLVSSAQEKILADGVEHYLEYAAVPLTTGGLQALGNVTIPWNVERTDLTIHKISIRRGGSTIDLLRPKDLLVLRRENNLEKAMLDGMRTVVVPVWGLQVGDILGVAFTWKTKSSTIAARPEEIQDFITPWPISWMERRFLVPDGVKVSWKLSPTIAAPEITRRPGMTEHRFVAAKVKPIATPKFAPSRYARPVIQVTGYEAWSEVANLLQPLFDKARRPAPGSPVLEEAKRIAAASGRPEDRMLAALRLTQEQVRYVALLLGEGAYVPMSADDTWDRKFGDCKGKTSLLLALLDRLGIEAEPVLVSNQHDDRLKDQLPSLLLFDHVLVRARIGGRTYYLDAVGYGQRTLGELTISPFTYGLPLRATTDLEVLEQGDLSAPLREASLVWDGSKGFGELVPYEATMTFRGSQAAAMRVSLSTANDKDQFDTALKAMVPRIPNEHLAIVDKTPEAADGAFIVRFRGKAPMDWSPLQGKRETRYTLSHNTLIWQVGIDRSEGPGKDWPVFIGAEPYWERTAETVTLPNGGRGYFVEAAELDRSVAGSRLTRTVTKSGDRVTMVAELRHLKREISAEEARTAVPVLEEIGEDYAYVVGPPLPKRKPAAGR
jgi:hypothetical protein